MKSKLPNLNLIQCAALLGIDKANASRLAHSGRLGKPHIAPGKRRKFYNIAAIEKYAGKKFTAVEIQAAMGVHDYVGPTSREIVFTFLKQFYFATIASRDGQWTAALAGQNLVGFTPPPLPKTKGNPS